MRTVFPTKKIIGCIPFAFIFVTSLQAAEVLKTEDVRVTASRVEKEISDVNMSVSVVTSDEISHSTARSVGELLEDIPGIMLTNDGGQGMKRVGIRGENATRTVIMIDGQRVAEHKSKAGAPILIDPAMIDRIEIIKGPASVLYGSDAIGGAVNIITKKGGTTPFEGNVTAGYNSSADGTNASATVFGSHEGWNYRLTAATDDENDLETPRGKMPNTGYRSKSGGLFLSYDIDPNKTLGATIDYYDLEAHSSDKLNPGFTVDVDKWERTKAAAFGEFRHLNESLVRLRTDVFYQKGTKDLRNTVPAGQFPAGRPSPGERPTPLPAFVMPEAHNELDQYGFSVQTDWQLGDLHYLIAGYEFAYDDLEGTSVTNASFTPVPGGMPDPTKPSLMGNHFYDGHQMTNAVYATLETEAGDSLKFNYGVRYTYVETEMDHYNRLRPAGRNNPDRKSASDGKAVFNAGLLWSADENLTLRANYAQGYRHPILQELYIDTTVGAGRPTKANENLKPETSDNFEVGMRWEKDGAILDAALFYSEADDYITVMKKAGEDRFHNVAEARTFGLELTASSSIGGTGFEPYLNLTLMKRRYDNGERKTWDTGTPLVTAVYGLRWQGEAEGTALRWDAFARSRSGYDFVNLDGNAIAGGDWSYGGYTTFNLKGGLDFGPGRAYSVDFGLYNVFDKLYENHNTMYEPGRYAAVKFNARF